MQDFKFFYEGTPHADGQITTGIKLLEGQPLDIALCLGTYATHQLRNGQPAAAVIVVNAYKKFKELNPDMAADIEKKLEFQDGARIIAAPKKTAAIYPGKFFNGYSGDDK